MWVWLSENSPKSSKLTPPLPFTLAVCSREHFAHGWTPRKVSNIQGENLSYGDSILHISDTGITDQSSLGEQKLLMLISQYLCPYCVSCAVLEAYQELNGRRWLSSYKGPQRRSCMRGLGGTPRALWKKSCLCWCHIQDFRLELKNREWGTA